MKILKTIIEWLSDKETEHRIELTHRYTRILSMKIERGDFNYEAQYNLKRMQSWRN